ncbi:GLUG motif-containing protein, partial [Sedimentisphaera salicampi]|uniref:GLUG motif-containing protein n=1 Tax=Sedimentisphaera salicampi TaxID=1941349 RepID=UPI0010556994
GNEAEQLGGLCGYNNSTIADSLTDCSVSGGNSSYDLGGLCGRNGSGSITNCYAEGSVSFGDDSWRIGGFCGRNEADLSSCHSSGTVSGGNEPQELGGLCGFNNGSIYKCYSTSDVTGYKSLGGLCGKNDEGIVTQCYAEGSVSGDTNSEYIGGLCGYNENGTIRNCYSKCSISGHTHAGGICGYNYFGNITMSYFAGMVNEAYENGGICGRNSQGEIQKCFWDVQNSNISWSAGGVPLTADEMKSASSYLGWRNDLWVINEGMSYPTLKWENKQGTIINTDYPAASYGGEGAEENPFEISTVEDMISMGLRKPDWDKSFELVNDIDMNSVSNYIPPVTFSGLFDGCGYSVINLSLDKNEIGNNTQLGLFGQIQPAGVVENLGIEAVTCMGNHEAGGVCGVNRGLIRNCNISGVVDCGRHWIGGVAGINRGDIRHCSFDGYIHGYFDVGGLCGTQNEGGVIEFCYSDSEISGVDLVGGAVGRNQGEILFSSCKSDVESPWRCGGFCGINEGSISSCSSETEIEGYNNWTGGFCGNHYEGVIEDCYSKGNVRGNKEVGGFCGENTKGLIRRCYSLAAVSGNENIGGFCGYNPEGTIIDCFWNTESSGINTSDGGIGQTAAQMQDINTYLDADWDFTWESNNGSEEVWYSEFEDFPVLTFEVQLLGKGTTEDPFIIEKPAGFSLISQNPKSCYKLASDIDFSGKVFSKALVNCADPGFQGVLDGRGCKIKNVIISSSSSDYTGLFSKLSDGAEIKDLTIENIDVTGYYYAGAICGKAEGAVIENCFAEGNVSGYGYVGGFCGLSKESYISNCSSTGEVSGNVYTGGFIGSASDGYINNSYCQSNVLARFAVGGFLGGNSAEVTNCYSAGTVEVFGDSGYVGGFCGSEWSGTATSCFWDTEASGMDTSDGGTGLTTAEMQTLSTFTDAGWDFAGESANGEEDIWFMEAGEYPELRWQVQEQGNGTPENPYQISTRADLEAVNDDLDAHYVLVNDIDLSGTTYDRAVIAPDTDYTDDDFQGTAFSGNFNGNGHEITGLTIDTNTNDFIGLFGLIGEWDDYDGFAAVYDLELSNCSIAGDGKVGSLCGWNNGKIFKSSSSGSVLGRNFVGGLIGYNRHGDTLCSYTRCSVSGEDIVGGFAGKVRAKYSGTGYILNCYSIGSVGGENRIGGFCGWRESGHIVNCFWDTENSGILFSAGAAEGKTTSEMQNADTYLNALWDFKGENSNGGGEIWKIEENQYPDFNYYPFTAGDGSYDNPYQISTPNELLAVNNNPFANYILINDIDLSNKLFDKALISPDKAPSIKDAQEISFMGSFLGNGNYIRNLNIESSGDFAALIGSLTGTVKDLNINNCSISGEQFIGGLAGINVRGRFVNCSVSGSISGSYVVGGFCGRNRGIIQNCYSECTVSGNEKAGGLCGDNRISLGTESKILNSYSVGQVSGNVLAGGIVGSVSDSEIVSSFWDEEVSGINTSAGGTGLTTEEMRTLSSFTDAGWDFVGENANGSNDNWLMPEGDYPRLTALHRLTVTFNSGENGSISSGDAEQSVPYAGDAEAPEITPSEGYEFTGWSGAFDTVTEDISITAQYELKSYAVTFAAGGNGTITSGNDVQDVDHGLAAEEPTVQPAEGYNFIGWDKAFDNITSELTVTAQYEIKTYTVTFVSGDNGTITSGNDVQEVDHGLAAEEPTVQPAEGYNFIGWDKVFDNITS